MIYTSTPSFPGDALFAEHPKARAPSVCIGRVGAKVAVDPHNSLVASDAIDFVCREELDFTCKEIAEGKPFAEIAGLSWRLPDDDDTFTDFRPRVEEIARGLGKLGVTWS